MLWPPGTSYAGTCGDPFICGCVLARGFCRFLWTHRLPSTSAWLLRRDSWMPEVVALMNISRKSCETCCKMNAIFPSAGSAVFGRSASRSIGFYIALGEHIRTHAKDAAEMLTAATHFDSCSTARPCRDNAYPSHVAGLPCWRCCPRSEPYICKSPPQRESGSWCDKSHLVRIQKIT